MNSFQELLEHTDEIEKKINCLFQNKQDLAQAFVHSSYVNEQKDFNLHNERLEFLGDSILGYVIAEWLYHEHPELPEGELSTMRSRLVDSPSCARYIQHLELEKYLLLGKGERQNSGKGRESINADLFEALVGAILLDGGVDAVKLFLFTKLSKIFNTILSEPEGNWKALIQDYCQKNFQVPPRYEVIDESGPDHAKTFEIAVFVNDQKLGVGKGLSKKEAQQSAAENAMSKLRKHDR